MQLRSDIQLKSMSKAMLDVVIPAIDPANSLAMEQAQLVLGMLRLMQHQQPIQYQFDRDELARLLEVMANLNSLCGQDESLASLGQQLEEQRGYARVVLDGSRVTPVELCDIVKDCRYLIAAIVREAGQAAALETTMQIEQRVLEYSKQQLLRDRALVVLQGWEPDPDALPSIESLLAEGDLNNTGNKL